MCNAWHHPPNCPCGWGHLGGGAWGYVGARTTFAAAKSGEFSYQRQALADGRRVVSPNASCPVCGAPVYFFQSENGGRVFFDDLGPPWPKHQCTDHQLTRKNTVLAPTMPSAPAPGASTWRTLQHVVIKHTRGVLSLVGLAQDVAGEHLFYFIGAGRLDGQYQFASTALIAAAPPQYGRSDVVLLHWDAKVNLRFKEVKLCLEARDDDVATWESALRERALSSRMRWAGRFRSAVRKTRSFNILVQGC
jgi:hypothetical protein